MSNPPNPPGVTPTAANAGALSSTEPAIKQFLSQHFLVSFGAEANAETDLFEQGFIDSYGYVELISFLEKTFKIRFTDEELLSRGLRSLNTIITMVEKKLNAN